MKASDMKALGWDVGVVVGRPKLRRLLCPVCNAVVTVDKDNVPTDIIQTKGHDDRREVDGLVWVDGIHDAVPTRKIFLLHTHVIEHKARDSGSALGSAFEMVRSLDFQDKTTQGATDVTVAVLRFLGVMFAMHGIAPAISDYLQAYGSDR